jgi:hypothetical protein
MAVTMTNIGFMISVLGDFTVDRQTAWMSIGSGVIYCTVRHRVRPRKWQAEMSAESPGMSLPENQIPDILMT